MFCRSTLATALEFCKLYPKARSFEYHFDTSSFRSRLFRIHECLHTISPILQHAFLDSAFARRLDPSNHLPAITNSDGVLLFPPAVIYCHDTFPIYVNRPRQYALQRSIYQGKYHAHVLKVCQVREPRARARSARMTGMRN
jgi:hypothetical protein